MTISSASTTCFLVRHMHTKVHGTGYQGAVEFVVKTCKLSHDFEMRRVRHTLSAVNDLHGSDEGGGEIVALASMRRSTTLIKTVLTVRSRCSPRTMMPSRRH